jgi:hypothetical protein
MSEFPERAGRIVLLARPALGRRIETILRGDGYEVHRTPGGDGFHGLVALLRPHLVIMALDIPWNDPVAVMREVREGPWVVPLLLLGETDPRFEGIARLPETIADTPLLAAVRSMLPMPSEHESAGP